MEARVTKRFQDAVDPRHLVYEVGDPFEGDADRVAGLAGRGFVEPVEAPRKAPRKRSARKGAE